MDRKDELDSLIRELSAKKQSYQKNQDNEAENIEKIVIPDLEPVDFDLSKNIFEENIQPEVAETPIAQEKPSVLESAKMFLSNLQIKNKISANFKKLTNLIKKKPKMFMLILLGLFLTVGFGAFAAGCSIFGFADKSSGSTLGLGKKEDSSLLGKDRVNILVLGIDSPNGKFDSRSDTMILVSLDDKNHTVSALSIPRDTYVFIPGHGMNKINMANEFGGPALTVKTVSDLLNVYIDHYAITNFEGFKDIINTLGGVDMDVEKDMHYRTYNGWINLTKGYQHLDGDKALQYVRFRHDALGDISRTQRQQKFIMSLAKEAMKPATFLKLPKLLPELSSTIKSDLSVAEMLSLASSLKGYNLQHLNTQTLPGNFMNIKGVSYWYVDEANAKKIVEEVFVGKTDSTVVNPNLRPDFADSPIKKQFTSPSNNSQKYSQPQKANSSVKDNTYSRNQPDSNSSVSDKTYESSSQKQNNPSGGNTGVNGNNSDSTNNTGKTQNQNPPSDSSTQTTSSNVY